MNNTFDVCVIGSGAGAGPVIYELSKAGYKTVVLEKGPWYTESDFTKDELAICRRDTYTPLLKDEYHMLERKNNQEWKASSSEELDWSFWNGNMVGGASNVMSGFFHRMKPVDFRLLSEFGPIEGANMVDWPISYDDMEPYYSKAEQLIGISGKIINHPQQEPRSTPDFPYPPTRENAISSLIDSTGIKLNYSPFPMPRAILSQTAMDRNSCVYTGYCGSYGCTTKAKGSSRAALIDPAVKTGNCTVLPHSMVYNLESNISGDVIKAHYYNKEGQRNEIVAKIFVVACQAAESSRLLLNSTSSKYKKGLGNNFDQVGKNIFFSAGGLGGADFHRKDFSEEQFNGLMEHGTFVNRALQDWYVINDHPDYQQKIKGGTIDFLMSHSNPVRRAVKQKYDNGDLIWGEKLKDKLEYNFRNVRRLEFEVFCDWLPTNDGFVGIDKRNKDKWGIPVGSIRINSHPRDVKIGKYLADKAEILLQEMGGKNITSSISSAPPANLMAGGCRFGKDERQSVLDPDCKIHETKNVYVTDSSFMPTGGSVTPTWTIYANAFRVADKIKQRLG